MLPLASAALAASAPAHLPPVSAAAAGFAAFPATPAAPAAARAATVVAATTVSLLSKDTSEQCDPPKKIRGEAAVRGSLLGLPTAK